MRRPMLLAGVLALAAAGGLALRAAEGPSPPAERCPPPRAGGGAAPTGADWFGGPSYYARWPNGPSSDPTHFPIGVWLQDPADAEEYRRMGINAYVGLWEGPTQEQLAALATAGMPTIAHQSAAALTSDHRSLIQGYLLADEPDMSGPPPEELRAQAGAVRDADPTRPTYLNLGKGAALPHWGGDEVQATIPRYVEACDICSVDYYAITDPWEQPWPENLGIRVYGQQVDRMRGFVADRKPVWVFLEATYINPEIATPEQVTSSAWMALIHGANGIQWFAHAFHAADGSPALWTRALLGTRETRPAVERVNRDVTALAPVLNSPPLTGPVEVASADPDVPIDTMVRSHGGRTYLFAIASSVPSRPQGGTTTGTFTLDTSATVAEVYGENRSVPVRAGRFVDDFGSNGGANFQHHIYVLDEGGPGGCGAEGG